MNQDDRQPTADATSDDCGHESALAAMSKELADTYEQINLLYKLGRSMNWLTKPRDFVNMACRLLLDTLQLTWLAVKSSPTDAAGVEMAFDLAVAGQLPCPREEFDALAAKILEEIRGDQGTMLLDPAEHDLAARVDSQVIAEPVMSAGRVAALILPAARRDRIRRRPATTYSCLTPPPTTSAPSSTTSRCTPSNGRCFWARSGP